MIIALDIVLMVVLLLGIVAIAAVIVTVLVVIEPPFEKAGIWLDNLPLPSTRTWAIGLLVAWAIGIIALLV